MEDILAGLYWLLATAEFEYHRPVLPGSDPQLIIRHAPNQLSAWLLTGTQRLGSARLYRRPFGLAPTDKVASQWRRAGYTGALECNAHSDPMRA